MPQSYFFTALASKHPRFAQWFSLLKGGGVKKNKGGNMHSLSISTARSFLAMPKVSKAYIGQLFIMIPAGNAKYGQVWRSIQYIDMITII